MLLSLNIQNLVLIDRAELTFGEGLNILTGETGAGKSAILSAIRLIAGNRAEIELVGKKGDLAIVEATLSSYFLPEELTPPFPGEPLVIRREIHRSGKSRCFANDQQISLTTLRQIVGSSIEIIGQSSSLELRATDFQRNLLDTYADTLTLAQDLADSLREIAQLKKKAAELEQDKQQRDRHLEWAEKDLATIEETRWEEGEEEKLKEEHHLLTHSAELEQKIGELTSALAENAPHLKRYAHLAENCARITPQLHSAATSLKTASLELDEANRLLQSYQCESNPQHLIEIEARIAALENLKRRFGKTREDVWKKKQELQAQIDHLSHLEEEQQLLQPQIEHLHQKNLVLAQTLLDKRKKSVPKLTQQILKELQDLNLPHAQLTIAFENELPIFLFSANPGIAPRPIEECASGGELSRLFLALKIALAEKEKTSCFVFDEIDSNVGGHSAAILGQKLRQLSRGRQLICVTHFVQVARCAMHHFLVAKSEATTSVCKLENPQREYQRMIGEDAPKNKAIS